MIRFNCPTCGRNYELPDALSGLPLVCKQCGQRITPPAPTPDLPPPPPKPVAAPPPPALTPAKPSAAPKAQPASPPVAPKPLPAKPPLEEPDDDDVLVSKPDSTPDIDFNIGGPTAASLSEAARARPAGLSDATRRPPDLSDAVGPIESIPELNLDLLGLPPAPPPKPPRPPAPPEPPAEPPAEPTVLPFLADLSVFLLLVVVGLMVGEFAVRKPMGQVISEAGSAARFPPIDLLLLLAPALMFGLIYLLLNSRERTVGAWLRRRAARAGSPDPK